MTKPLTVYKASAGSGKTFRLTVEYIKLLVSVPTSYRQILAVTFTNKATEEMKMRILSQLYGIWKGLEDSQSYSKCVEEELGISQTQVATQAGIALHLLLHNYSYFRVETIDSFFQNVLRNLARELELTANLRISLNDYQVEEQAVDRLIDNLHAGDKMLQWLLKYIMDNISEDHSWNVIGQIKKFGQTIFKDYYKEESSQLHKVSAKKDFFEDYATMLREQRAKAKNRMKQLGDTFFNIIESEDLCIDDFANKSRGICSLFIKLRRGDDFDEKILTKTVADTVGNPAKWYSKTSPKAEHIYALAESHLDNLLRTVVSEQPLQWRRYKSADLTLRHLSQLRLLSSIEDKVRELNESANRFLLSDTQKLLHDLIEDSDSPFIYEKIGTQLEHIMIDEFQDTSTVQWQNFKVLLEETMSHHHCSNLIVGDVKQSIYRWRSGDWRLLAHINDQFSNAEERLHVTSLDTNYRSDRRVVDFNNAFFIEAARQEGITAYGKKDDISQKVPDRKGNEGMVNVTLLPQDNYQQATLSMLLDQIDMLMANGTPATDIAILVRTNKHIPLIANYLMEQRPDFPVVSDEAFRLDASSAVTTIIQALRYLSQPDDVIAGAYLRKVYSGQLDGPLPDGFDHTLLLMPLYDLAERLYGMFHLNHIEGQSAYLCAFYDQISAYINENTSDVNAFLREWDETLSSKTIQSPELSGVRIISIHKSKGLEFPVVLIPFCDWRLEMNDVLWCHPKEAPYNQLPIAAIDYSKGGMTGTIYEQDYKREHEQNLVDNLNLLYVAFTRAAKMLYVIGRRNVKSSRSALIEQVLPIIAQQLTGAVITGEEDDKAPLSFTYGSPSKSLDSHHNKRESEELSKNPFLQKARPLAVNIEVFDKKVIFRQSNKSIAFAQGDDNDDADVKSKENYIQLGSVLHEVFSTIRTTADIDTALHRMELEGIIYDRHITRQHIETLIRQRLDDKRVADWFSDRWSLFNECSILHIDPLSNKVIERRPDRVIYDESQTIVIDYKFGKERRDYHVQVNEYMKLLRQMGYQDVKGYLWYVYTNKIVEVD